MTELEKAARQALEALALMVAVEWQPAFTRKEYDSDEPEENEMRERVLTAITALRRALEQQPADEPVAQWQKRHPARTDGQWENTNEHDAKWWRNNSQGWEIRALYTTPFVAPVHHLVPDPITDLSRAMLAAAPEQPAAQWVGLADEEMKQVCYETFSYDPYVVARAIEAKLREKNGGKV